MANVFFKTSTNKTIDDLFIWTKSSGALEPNYDEHTGVPFSLGTVYFTSDGYIVFDTKDNLGNNKRIWMSKNAYSAIYAEDVSETNTDIANAIKYSIHYVEGPTTDTIPGTWTGTINGITELYNGLTIIYVPAVAGGSSTTTLNINGLGAKTCYYSNTSAMTTHYSVGTPILLTYRNNCWRRADYNSNTTYATMSVAEMRTGTATSTRSMRADYLKTFLSTLGGTNLTLTHSGSEPYLQLNHDPSGITAGTYGNNSQQTPSYGGTFNIPYFTVDAQGHITNASTTTVKLPASDNTDYKVRQTPINSNDNNNYRILLSNSANDTSEDSISKKNANLIYNSTENKLSTGNLDLTGNINVVGDATFNNTTTIDNAILNSLLVSGNSSFVNNVNFTQIPTAPTAAAGTNTTQIATTEFVTNAVTQGFVANDAMVFKGLIGSNQLITQLPTSGYNAGWTYRVANAGIFAGEYCEVGDLLIAINDGPVSGSSVINTDWGKVEHNIDGAVFRGSGASNSSVGSSTQPVYVNSSGIVTAITSLEVEAGGTGKDSRRKAGLFYDWTASLKGQKWSRICYIPCTNNLLGSTMILNIRHTRSSVVYNETVMITVNHNSKGNITSLSSSNYNQNSTIQIRVLVNSSGNCYIELKDSNQGITEGTAISPVYCTLQIISLGNDEPTLKTNFEDGTTLPENYSVAAEVALGRNRIITSGIFSGNLEGNATTATTASKLSNTSKIGDTNKPVYFKADGTPAAINYTIDKAVPSNAVFTDRYVNSATFADDSTNTAASPVKMTLTRAGSDTATVTANIPKVSNSSAGVVPKGAAVSSQNQSTKFLREDGTWAVPSYTVNTNTDTLVKQTAKSDNVNYKILMTTSDSPTSGNANEAAYDTDITINPSTHTLTAAKFIGSLQGNAATATALSSSGTTNQFWCGDNRWSDTLGFIKINNEIKIKGYGDNNNYWHSIKDLATVPLTNDRWHYLPNTTGWIVTSATTGTGNSTTPIYIDEGGITRAITGTISNNTTGNAATATTAGGITSAGTTAQFWRGDNSWSNMLEQTATTTLGIDPSDLRIGRAIRTLHIATKENGSGAGITEGDAAGLTFGISTAAYAGIYYQSSSSYGSRLYFATTNSFGNGAYARMMITHDGKVGIHTTSPSTRLHVDGGVTVTDLTASQAVSTNANQKLVSTNLTTADPTASSSGITYIATISQNAVGKITATKSTVRSASTSQTGVLQFTAENTNAQLNTLTTGTSTPKDNDYYISQYAGGGTTTTTYHRRPVSALWNYMSGKITNGIYWANVKTTSAATYKAQPEVASIKINGKTAAGDTDSTSAKNVQLIYDASLETLNFVFS